MSSQNLLIFESVQFYMLKADIFLKATIQSDNYFERASLFITLSSLHSLGDSFCWCLVRSPSGRFECLSQMGEEQ